MQMRQWADITKKERKKLRTGFYQYSHNSVLKCKNIKMLSLAFLFGPSCAVYWIQEIEQFQNVMDLSVYFACTSWGIFAHDQWKCHENLDRWSQ